MQRSIRLGTLAATLSLLAGTLLAADPTPKDQVQSAAKALADKDNYSWHSAVANANGGGNGRGGGPTDGKTEKGGFTTLSMTRGNNTIEAVLKGDKGAIKTANGWQSLADAAQAGGGQGNPGGFIARTLQNFKAPAVEASDLADKAANLTKADDVISGDLTEDGAKSLMAFGRRGGANAPVPANAKGSVKYWLKDGALAKYEYNVQGTITFNGNDININRTTTVEIKDVGTTKVDVADDAKAKVG